MWFFTVTKEMRTEYMRIKPTHENDSQQSDDQLTVSQSKINCKRIKNSVYLS